MYKPNKDRYNKMKYNYVGNSGLKLPQISLGLWQNFGDEKPFEDVKEIVLKAFDSGITHFDLSNNYGKPAGSAERNLGKILSNELKPYRDELIISTKAGFKMWDGPYGDRGSRKYLISSLNQSLERLQLDYVDIFYHHVADYDTPLIETMTALADIVKMGKALYVGISNYPKDRAIEAQKILRKLGVELLILQPRFNMFDQTIIDDKTNMDMKKLGVGIMPYSVLDQGMLTDKYIDGIPEDSRMRNEKMIYLNEEDLTVDKINKVKQLNEIAKERNQTVAQLALSWSLNVEGINSVLIGVSRLSQLEGNLKALENSSFSKEELHKIDNILRG